MKRILLAAVAAIISSSAFAADLPTKAPPVVSYQYPSKKCGLYYGIDTKGTVGTVANAAVGTTATGGAIGLTVGWTCPVGAGYWYIDGDFDFANFNGSSNGFAVTGPAIFEQRFGFGVPVDMLVAAIPGLASLQNAVPSLSKLPDGVSLASHNWGIFASISEEDIGIKYGLQANRAWMASGNIGISDKARLSNGIVMEPYAEYMLPSTQQCFGQAIAGGCIKELTRVRAGLKFLF